jgi:hypothetical protein
MLAAPSQHVPTGSCCNQNAGGSKLRTPAYQAFKSSPDPNPEGRLEIKIQEELIRRRPQVNLRQFSISLVFDPSFDYIWSEYITL